MASGSLTKLLTVLAARVVLSTVIGMLIWAHAPALVLGWRTTVVLGGSMRPRLTPGDLVVYERVPGRTVRGGQVVVVIDPVRPPSLLVHRVGKVLRNGTLVTAGDNNHHVDSTPVPPKSVLGLGRLRIPWIGLPVTSWRERDYGMAVGSVLLVLITAHLAALRLPDPGGPRHRLLPTPSPSADA